MLKKNYICSRQCFFAGPLIRGTQSSAPSRLTNTHNQHAFAVQIKT